MEETGFGIGRRRLLGLSAAGAVAATGSQAQGAGGGVTATDITFFGARTDAADNSVAIQRAIESAMRNGRTVYVPPGTFNYTRLDFGRNDAVKPTRLVLTGTGTLRSTVPGTSIVASGGAFYDLVIDGLRFESVAGAGTRLIDGARFIRLIITPGTQIENFDWVIHAGADHLQSVRMLGVIIRGGYGAVVQAPMAYDCVFAQNILEFGRDGFVIDGGNDPAVHSCKFVDNNIEGMSGRAMVFGSCLATTVGGNYLEDNRGGDILLNAGTAPHKGLRVQGNSIQLSAARLAAGAFGIVWGRSTALPVKAGGNFCTGPLHDTEGASALIDMTGDWSQVALYRGHGRGAPPGPAPVGRAVYSDGLAQHISWADRYLSLDPHQNEIRFGGKHDSQVGNRREPPVICFGPAPPADAPKAFERTSWARGSIVINVNAGPGAAAAWICIRAGQPGRWEPIALSPTTPG